MNSSCFPIGMFDHAGREINSVDLVAGDVLVRYTDGIIEAENAQGEEFGMERLSALIQNNYMLSADGLMSNILESANDFCRELGFNDDVTLLIMKCNFDGR